MEKKKKIILGIVIAIIAIFTILVIGLSLSVDEKDIEAEKNFNNGIIIDSPLNTKAMSFSEIESYMKSDFVNYMNTNTEFTLTYKGGYETANYYVFLYWSTGSSDSGAVEVIFNKETAEASLYRVL